MVIILKKITIVVPTYNEELNVPIVYERVKNIFLTDLKDYEYKILFVDNCSEDNCQNEIRKLAQNDSHVQYIFYVKNFGFSKSTFYGLTQSKGDCTVLLFADLQDPPELIPEFVKRWEMGQKVVVGIKNKSKENRMMYGIRKMYYHIMSNIADIDHIEQFTGFGLYDSSVIEVFSNVEDPLPYLRGMVAELAPKCDKIFYEQSKRINGKSSFKFWKLYDVAMLGITSYSKAFMRIATALGTIVSTASIIIAIITFIFKILGIVDYPIGNAAILFGVYFLGGIILMFLGIIGEYIANINVRTMKHPLVVEKERFNI